MTEDSALFILSGPVSPGNNAMRSEIGHTFFFEYALPYLESDGSANGG